MNNISLDSFRAISQGKYNLGFVKLTHQDDGTVGIDKANNHHILGCIRNNEDASASADNRMVREQLVNAFKTEGATEEFLTNIRERLGLNNDQRTADVLTRDDLRDIIRSYDGAVERNAKGIDAVVANVFAKTPKAVVDVIAEQIKMVKDRYVVAMATAVSQDEHDEVIAKLTVALRELKNAFAPDEIAMGLEVLDASKKITDNLKASAEATQRRNEKRVERGNSFNRILGEIEKLRDAYLAKIKENHTGKSLPGFTENQTAIIGLAFTTKINEHFNWVVQRNASLREQYIDGEVDDKAVLLQLKEMWSKIEFAIDAVEIDIVNNGPEGLKVNDAKIVSSDYEMLKLGVGVLVNEALEQEMSAKV